ncbi:hypothetical protein ULG90_04575 [Halopseudomonas pachastrellae]|nr:hypothetical protein ULG90_04575 [Halopseudomonas pachastrellae]
MQAQGVLVEEKIRRRELFWGFCRASVRFTPVSRVTASSSAVLAPLYSLGPGQRLRWLQNDQLRHHQAQAEREMDAELSALDDKLTVGEIDSAAYILSKREIEQKYDFY